MPQPALPRYFESSAHELFRRCVQCPDTTPSCPPCADDEECSFVPTSCDFCASSKCIKNPNASSKSSSGSSPAGPIAGGVIGGILLVVAIVVLVWFFYIKKKRQTNWQTQLADLRSVQDGEKTPPDNLSYTQQHKNQRQSTLSVATTKTTDSRRSNFIQIAYIPGVTGTGTAMGSPEMVPPVPPIPAAGHGVMSPHLSPHLNTGTEQFFTMNDIRPESTYGDRKSFRSTARSSIAASEYHHDAIVDPMPARAAVATRAVPISIAGGSRMGSPTASPHLSHQSSIAGRMQGPMTGQSVKARQVMVTRSQSNLNKSFAFEMEDTSPAPTPRVPDRSGTASPRSLLSDDAASGYRYPGSHSPHQPVSAVRSEFSQSRGSPVSNNGWEQNANIRNTIRDAALLGYGQQPQQTLHQIAELDGDTVSQNGDPKSPFGDRHATATP